MPTEGKSDNGKNSGEIRVRSNVCFNQSNRRLIPGDVLKSYGMPLEDATPAQKEEMMYYAPCCRCNRKIYEISEDGCDRDTCRYQGIPSTAEAMRRKQDRHAHVE